MKKVFLLIFLFVAGMSISYAQQGGDPAARLQQMKERIKPQLIEKAKLTDAEADKVIEINFEARSQMRGFRDLSPEERQKKMSEVNAVLTEKYKAIPLTEEKVKSVVAYFEEQRKQMMERRGGNGGGN